MITSKQWKKKILSQYDLQVCQSNLFLFIYLLFKYAGNLNRFCYFIDCQFEFDFVVFIFILLFLFCFLTFMLI